MAQKPDGKSARTERVTFTSGAADRIAKVVRTVEAGDRDTGPLTFGARIGGVSGKTFRVCTFTGAWSINATKTVTFRNQTATPNTVAAVNLFYTLPDNGTSDCAIAKEGTAWYLVQEVHTQVTVITGAALSTAGLVFTRSTLTVVATATASVTTITTTAC